MVKYTERVDELFSAQLRDWQLASLNYELLSNVRTRAIDFEGFRIYVQFNPERIRSSSAKVDTKSIESRPCFLCEKNRPSEQMGVPFGKDMTILINPFPIFSKHLTIPTEKHIDQRIGPSFGRMLDLSEAIPEYVVFYNGPQCGASAPDHLHFQAGMIGFLPIEKDFEDKSLLRLVSKENQVEIWHWRNYLRGILTLKGSDKDELIQSFSSFYERFYHTQPEKPEPMLNILVYYNIDEWIIHLVPRKIHRPFQFFERGENQILLSPASVDLGGVIITPREEDFNKITASDIKDIFSQVCLDENEVLSFFS